MYSSGGITGPRVVIWISCTVPISPDGYDPLQFGVVAVETAVEVDHRDDAAGVGVLHDVDGAGQVEVDGLFTQRRDARRRPRIAGVRRGCRWTRR